MPERGDLLFHEPQCNTQSKRVVSWWHERCNNQQFSLNKATAVNVPYLSHYWRGFWKELFALKDLSAVFSRNSATLASTVNIRLRHWKSHDKCVKYWELLWNCPKWGKNSSCWTSSDFCPALSSSFSNFASPFRSWLPLQSQVTPTVANLDFTT